MPDFRETRPRETLRLGLVSYLNSRPIGYGLLSGRQRGRFQIVQGVPSDLAEALGEGRVDLALLPSVEYARARSEGRNLAIVPGIAIASFGPAESVLLFARVAPARIRSIAVDLASRTSVALLRLLLRRRLGASGPEPRLVPAAPDLPAMLDRCDAALVIGDRALLAAREHPALARELSVHDLGSEWGEMTGLPFVFAFWAGPPIEEAGSIVSALQDSLDEGLRQIPAIAREFASGDAEVEAIVRRYLSASMRYGLGGQELEGLRTFFRLLREENLLAGPEPEIVFQA